VNEARPSYDGLVKVVFDLDPDEDGWPPAETEGIWARPLGMGEYVLDNVPWFARGFAFADRVAAEPDNNGVLWVTEKREWSGRYTIRVMPLGEGPSEVQVQDVIDRFAALGVDSEGALPRFPLVALDVPRTAALAEVKALLVEGEADGRWGYEEGCIDEAWKTL
jgi:hypothetical protein